tara:strand:+ start:535 stop:798 length:264 start_codon:yes stop_codon:yes gene_type:complete
MKDHFFKLKRLAFLAAASIAFIAISEPPSAEADEKWKCHSGCDDKIAKKYGEQWSYGDLSPADQQSWLKCEKKCKKDFKNKGKSKLK